MWVYHFYVLIVCFDAQLTTGDLREYKNEYPEKMMMSDLKTHFTIGDWMIRNDGSIWTTRWSYKDRENINKTLGGNQTREKI